MIYLHFVCVYVGTECLHLVVVCVEFDWCLELVGCVVGWLCIVLNLYKLNISS